MKKKIIALLLCVQMLAAAIPVCASAPAITYNYDDSAEVLSLDFNTEDSADTVITLSVMNESGEYAAVKELAVKNGACGIKLSLAAGRYTVRAKRQDTLEVCEAELNLTGEEGAEIFSKVQQALVDKDAAAIDAIAEEYAGYLKTVKTDGAGALMAAADNSGIDSAEKFAAAYNGFAAAAILNAAQSYEAFDELLNNSALAAAVKLDELPKVGSKNAYEYSSAEIKQKIAEKVCEKSDYKGIDDVTEQLQKEVFFANISFGTTDSIKDIFKAYIDAGKLSAAWNDYQKLSSTKQRTVIEGLKGTYTSYAEAGSRFDTLVKNASINNNNNTSSGGGGGGGSSSTISVGAPSATPVPDTQQTQTGGLTPQYIFSDMEDAKWANEAVECLYRRGVISGVGDGKFAPSRTVTRAEFAKMLMSMANASISDSAGSIPFTDVVREDWSYNYIASAYQNGIVRGMSDTLFGRDDNVTREQAAVFIERLIDKFEDKKPDPGLNVFVEFDDIDEASDWARDSVLYLLRISMIKGKENQNFKPKDYLTRAEAAYMFYSYLVVMGREGK